jgi:hypothetical protein
MFWKERIATRTINFPSVLRFRHPEADAIADKTSERKLQRQPQDCDYQNLFSHGRAA